MWGGGGGMGANIVIIIEHPEPALQLEHPREQGEF
jgi:hypothetical protein